MNIELDWLEPFEEGTPEGVTYAALSLLVGGSPVTEVEDAIARTLRENVLVSVYPLARFMAENWWRLRWEPAPPRMSPAWRLRHCLSAIGEGYSWPNLTFSSDGEAIHVHLVPSGESRTSPIRYVNGLDEWITAGDFERPVDDFMEAVAGRLEAMGLSQTGFTDLLEDLRTERNDNNLSRWRRLEAIAGFDADEAPEGFIRSLLNEAESIGWESLQELTAASRGQALTDIERLRDELADNGASLFIADLPRLQDAVANELVNQSRPPWLRAAAAARITRQTLGLNGEVVSNRQLSELFNMTESLFESGDPSGAPCTASLHPADARESRIVINKRLSTSRRFAICRLLGDRLFSGENAPLSAATDAGTARQKFQRAFSQELLCPFDTLKDMLDHEAPSEDDIETAAEHFQVSPLLVRTTLVNRRLLPRDSLDN